MKIDVKCPDRGCQKITITADNPADAAILARLYEGILDCLLETSIRGAVTKIVEQLEQPPTSPPPPIGTALRGSDRRRRRS